MESFNKVLYFILGLVVVLVFIIVFTGRLNLGKTFRPLANITPSPSPKVQEKRGFFDFFRPKKPTVTPTPRVQATPTPSYLLPTNVPQQPQQQMQPQQPQQVTTSKGGVSQAQTIPATGSPIGIIALAIPTLTAGLYLRRKR